MTAEITLAPPVLETLIDLRPPELERPDSQELIVAMQILFLKESVFAPAAELESLLSASVLYSSLRDPFAALVFLRRLAYHAPTARVSDAVVVFADLVSEGSPGKAVQWAHAVAKASHQLDTVNTGNLTFDRLMTEYFSDGLPTEAGHHRIWSAQKRPREHQREHRGSDNWLDYAPEVWHFSREPAPVS